MTATLVHPKRRIPRNGLAALPKPQREAARELGPIFGRFAAQFDTLNTARIVVAAIEEELDRHPAPRNAMAAALTRGVLAREQLKQAEGGSMSAEEARRLLGLSKESVLKRYRNGMLLGWREARQDAVRFPVWQFSGETEDHLLPGLEHVLEILGNTETLDDWGRVLFFLNPRDSLGGKCPLGLLREGRLKAVLAIAQAAAE
jgi:hypothetical protein